MHMSCTRGIPHTVPAVVCGSSKELLRSRLCQLRDLIRPTFLSDWPTSPSTQEKFWVLAGYLPQDPVIDGSLTVLDAVLASDSDAAVAVREYQRALSEAGGDGSDGSGGGNGNGQRGALDAAMDRMNSLNAWALDTEVTQIH